MGAHCRRCRLAAQQAWTSAVPRPDRGDRRRDGSDGPRSSGLIVHGAVRTHSAVERDANLTRNHLASAPRQAHSSPCPRHPPRESAGHIPPPKAQPAPGNAQANGPRRAGISGKPDRAQARGPHRRSKGSQSSNLSGTVTEGGHRCRHPAGGWPCSRRNVWFRTLCQTTPPPRLCKRPRSTPGTAATAPAWWRSRAMPCRCNTI